MIKKILYVVLVVIIIFAGYIYYIYKTGNTLGELMAETNALVVSDQGFINDAAKIKLAELGDSYKYHRIPTLPFYDKSLLAQEWSDSIVSYIENIKSVIFKAADKQRYSVDVATCAHILLGDDEKGQSGLAHQLKLRLEEYTKNMTALWSTIYHNGEDSANAYMNRLYTTSKYDYHQMEIPWEIYTFKDKSELSDRFHLSFIMRRIRIVELKFITDNSILADLAIKRFIQERPNMQ